MVIFAYPDTLFNLSVESFGVYVRDFMKRLITDPTHRRGPDGKYHHHQEPCSRLQEYITCYVPPNVASDITPRLMRHVSLCYNELINGTFKIACEEIAPHVIKAVIHPSVKCLDVMRNEAHPTLLDYYKDINIDLIYRALPLLQGFKTLRFGEVLDMVNIPLEVEGFRKSLEEFACPHIWSRDLATLAENCNYVKRLNVGGPLNYTSMVLHYISKFKYIEELNISGMCDLSESELYSILLWLAGLRVSYEESSEDAGSSRTRTRNTSEDSGMSSVAEGSRTYPARNSGLLKSFGCLNATDKHLNLISQFYNLTSLVLVNVCSSASLAPLKNLKLLKEFTLAGYRFSDTEEVLKSIGNQLICLNVMDTLNTDLSFISHYCRSLECLHICFSYFLVSGENNRHRESRSGPILDFPHVVALQVCSGEIWEREDLVNHFPNLRKLSVLVSGENVFLDWFIERKRVTRVEELYWGSDTVVHFNGNTATKTVFYFDGEVTVQHIRT
jgi:hypothetical protein